MKHSFKSLVAATVVASIVGAAGSASAAAATPAEAKCHAAIGKGITKYQATLAKNLIGCHKGRSSGKIPASTDCNVFGQADTKGKASGAQGKIAGKIDKACTADLTNVLALYPRCPSPTATSDDGPPTTGIDNFGELEQCLFRISEAYMDRVGTQLMGNPDLTEALTKDEQNCQGGIGKAFSKAIKTVGKTYSKCQSGVEKAGGDLDYGATCIGGAGDSAGKVAAAITAIKTAIDSTACATLDQDAWHKFGTCGQSAANMELCAVDRAAEPVARGLVGAALEFPNTAGALKCASSADVIINAAFGEKLSDTNLDSGYTGLAHHVDVVDKSLGGVKLQNCNNDCENCEVRLDPTNGYCRCENNPTVTCDGAIEGADATDCGASSKCVGGSDEGEVCATGATCNSGFCGTNTCHCMFGPPLALSSGGTPVCVVNRFAQEFTGGTSVVGAYDVGTRTFAIVHTGLNGVVPCPTCTGGTCDGGLRDGKTGCTVDATHPDFGAVSFDCPPDPATNISGAGLNLGLQFTSGSVSLTAAITTGSGNCALGTCHCSECSGNPLVGCASNADCAAVAAGTCGVNLAAANPKQNSCTGGVANCDANSDCSAGPFDLFCGNVKRQNGEGVLPCTNNGDCDTLDPDCPGSDCGACDLTGQRACFPATISDTGTPGIFNSEGVSVFCSAATGNAGVNAAGGLPGPGRVKLDFDFNIYCSDHTTRFQVPGGSNCP